jgi:hypothetical protein
MDRLTNNLLTLNTLPVAPLLNVALALIVIGVVLGLCETNVIARNDVWETPVTAAASQAVSPSDTVREFYRLMREKKFREAFALSIYQPAIQGLKQAEFDDLRIDFERLAAVIPEKVDISGEQISGETATVFIRVKDEDAKEQPEPVTLIRLDGKWIVGDRDNMEIVKKAGTAFFFNARIDTHHTDVQDMLQRISVTELVYAQQHGGRFGDLAALILAGLVPKDLEGTESTGYRFRVSVSADGKNWTATAEPVQYGRSGRLSFFMDQSGIRSGDVGGKPLSTTALKN